MRFQRGGIVLILDGYTSCVPTNPCVDREREPIGLDADLEPFFAELTFTYLPLLRCLQDLQNDQIPYRLTISLSPSLLHLLADSTTQLAYGRYLDAQLATDLPDGIRDRTASAAELWHNRYKGRVAGAFAELHRAGSVELLATTATRSCLPLLAPMPGAVEQQVANGVIEYQRVFSEAPKGFWLPAAGYAPGVDDYLVNQGIAYSFAADRHDMDNREAPPLSLRCPSGLRIFRLDLELAARFGRGASSYPSTPPHFHASGRTAPYDPQRARWVAAEQGRDFAEAVQTTIVRHGALSREPVICCALAANVLGTTWAEGLDWLESFLRATGSPTADVRTINLRTPPPMVESALLGYPETGSADTGGDFRRWIGETNDWIYPHLHFSASRWRAALSGLPQVTGLQRRAANQAARELLLAQNLEIAERISNGDRAAARAFCEHVAACHRLIDQLERGTIDEAGLTVLETRNRVLPALRASATPRSRATPSTEPTGSI